MRLWAPPQRLAVLLLILWLALTVAAFWWYQARHIQRFNSFWASFEGTRLEHIAMPASERPLVVHFVDANCPCSRFARPHIADLETRHRHARFATVDALAHPAISTASMPATPAVAIWSASGELAYYGPYSGGQFCGQGQDFVSTTLAALKEGYNPRWINQEAVGCFCPTQPLSHRSRL
jgi:hypothetical protein